jgi:hypothetical protein
LTLDAIVGAGTHQGDYDCIAFFLLYDWLKSLFSVFSLSCSRLRVKKEVKECNLVMKVSCLHGIAVLKSWLQGKAAPCQQGFPGKFYATAL